MTKEEAQEKLNKLYTYHDKEAVAYMVNFYKKAYLVFGEDLIDFHNAKDLYYSSDDSISHHYGVAEGWAAHIGIIYGFKDRENWNIYTYSPMCRYYRINPIIMELE